MMIVDLIDEVDLKEKLRLLGVPIHQEQRLADVQETVLLWLKDNAQHADLIQGLCSELQQSHITVLPDVMQVITALDNASH